MECPIFLPGPEVGMQGTGESPPSGTPQPLKRSPRAADIRAMGISGVSPHRKPVPKATCPGCRRPVVLLKSDRCLYCGASTGGPATPVAPASRLPAELLIALEPRARSASTGSLWLRRVIALGGAVLLTALIMGPCMRT